MRRATEMRRLLAASAVIAALSMTFAGIARALTIQYDAPFSGEGTVMLPTFDPILGVLTAAVLTVNAEALNTGIRLDNPDPFPVPADTLERNILVTATALDLGDPPLSATLVQSDSIVVPPETFGFPYNFDFAGFSNALSLTLDPLLEEAGSLQFDVQLISFVLVEPPWLLVDSDPIDVVGELSITYTYIPEPTTALLLVTGLAGLAMRRSRQH